MSDHKRLTDKERRQILIVAGYIELVAFLTDAERMSEFTREMRNLEDSMRTALGILRGKGEASEKGGTAG